MFHLQHSFLFDDLINISLQPQTLVLLVMAVSMSASKETITEQRALVMPITSWRAMKRLAEVLDIFLFNPVRVFGIGQYNAPTNKMHKMARAQGLILSKS